MAKNLKFTRSTTDKISIKGVLSIDGSIITYIDNAKNEQQISVADCMAAFGGRPIDFAVSVKSEEDLDIVDAE